MDDTISQQMAIDLADYTDYPGLAIEDVKKVTDEVVKGLKRLPSIDAVPVVRCEDCLMHGVCRFELGLGLDGFCSQGKRKES